jgi:Tol biopolymer transport system component
MRALAPAFILAFTFALIPGSVAADEFGAWAPAVSVEVSPGADDSLNTAALEGCPSVSPDGLSLFFASNRAGGFGGLDIYVSHRAKRNDAWGAPVNAGLVINTAGDEFCPTPLRDGTTLLFVSTRQDLTVHCGGSDIYRTTNDAGTWTTPVNLGCDVNSTADEASPFLVGANGPAELYFSSTRSGASHIYVAQRVEGWDFTTPELVAGVNSTASDARPNVRHDGLEMCFDSTRSGGFGASDIYMSSRATTSDAWSTPVNAGSNVNSAAGEARCSLSWSATAMYFGSTRAGGEGSFDLYVTTRSELDD